MDRVNNAIGLYMEGIRDGNPRAAVTKYTGARYTQHSTGVADGIEGFVAFFEPFITRTPVRDIRVLRSFQDGNHVFCQAFQSLNNGEAEWVTMDLFDTDEDGRIIEHWDVIAPYEAPLPSGEDMIGGPVAAGDASDTQSSKTLVREYVKQVLTEGHFDRLGSFVAPDVIQHVPGVENGRAALQASLRSGAYARCEMLFLLIGEGELVATLSKTFAQGQDYADVDLYRVRDGLIAEHWGVREPILPRGDWGNSGKF
jgi:predicted SnoaL-like aldol condensation-catalyzing enzyme